MDCEQQRNISVEEDEVLAAHSRTNSVSDYSSCTVCKRSFQLDDLKNSGSIQDPGCLQLMLSQKDNGLIEGNM